MSKRITPEYLEILNVEELTNTKRCSLCGKYKDRDEFYKGHGRHERNSRCIDCSTAYGRESYRTRDKRSVPIEE